MAGKRQVGERNETPIGTLVRERRLALGRWNPVLEEQVPMPFRELALRTNRELSASYLAELEHGQKRLQDATKARALAIALGCSEAEVQRAMGFEGIANPIHSLEVALRELGLDAENISHVRTYADHLLAQQKRGRGR